MPLTTGSMRRNPNYALLYLYHYIVPGLRRCIYVICMVSASCPRHESAVKPVNPFLRPGQAISKRTSCLFFSPLSPTPSSICMCRGVSPVPTPSSSDLVASAPNSAGGSFPGPPGNSVGPVLSIIPAPDSSFFSVKRWLIALQTPVPPSSVFPRLFLRMSRNAIPRMKRLPSDTPTPIPAFAPTLSPLSSDQSPHYRPQPLPFPSLCRPSRRPML